MAEQNKLQIAQELNEVVSTVVGQHHIKNFEKAFLIADATSKLKSLLTKEYMKPIMELQDNKLGFKVDKIYPENVVKDCLIEAVLTGLQPVGNQFNIIAGNMYPTKEGLGYLLGNFKGLSYKIIPGLPRINQANTSAAIEMIVKWKINNGTLNEEKLDIPIKVNKFMGTDAVIGKATRKARAWLYSTITGSEISDGEVDDLDSPVHLNKAIEQNPEKVSLEKEQKRVLKHIEESKTLEELEQVEDALTTDELLSVYEEKKNELVFS